MLDSLAWLGIETTSLDRAQTFYADVLDLPVRESTDSAITFEAGDVDLVVRRSMDAPRGGVHTHFAFAIPADEYEAWRNGLDERFELEEHDFGSMRSLFLYDPGGHCVELGQRDVQGPGIDGIFEIVLEVADLERAESFYSDLGLSVMDRGDGRRRVRLTGPVDLELWEPHLGIADGQGGIHVDLGFTAPDPDAAINAISDRAASIATVENGQRFRDPDGHVVTIRRSEAARLE
ncbi:MAG: catechol-2,3-dioxygenase [Halobacteriales archaeon]|jgi:catechol-2,3-dioxygenase